MFIHENLYQRKYIKPQYVRLFRERFCIYIVGVKQQSYDHSILESWNSVHLYTDGYDMINKVHELQAIAGINPDCPEYAAAGMLAGICI